MEEIVNLFVNNGVAVACLIYFMWFNNNTMKEFTNKMEVMNQSILQLLTVVSDKKESESDE